jgi:predicted AAA+ superfamily ATPase
MEEQKTLIGRPDYLNWLLRWKDTQMVKVVSGVRRSGKSTLFSLYRAYLLSHGVSERQIITINFENVEYEQLCDYKKLYEYIKKLLIEKKKNYIFLDEIQHVASFEKAVDSLYIKKNCDLYITGSNGYFMSGELATLLTGRYVELKILPLSFKEFCSGLVAPLKKNTAEEKLNYFIEYGAFPYTLQLQKSTKNISEYLSDLYDSILLKDVVKRLNVADVDTLERVSRFLIHNTGSQSSPATISHTLISAGNHVDQKTVSKYLGGLCDSLLFYKVPQYNIRGKKILTTQNKYYPVDTGFRNLLVKTTSKDAGHLLENIVFLELLRKNESVYTGQIDSEEVDFITVNGKDVAYYQVALSTLSEETLERELLPLQKIKDAYPKYLLTLDTVFKDADYDGIKKMNVIEWLLH